MATDIKKKTCPACGNGIHGKDSLCDDHWREYLGTHAGGRGHDEVEVEYVHCVFCAYEELEKFFNTDKNDNPECPKCGSNRTRKVIRKEMW